MFCIGSNALSWLRLLKVQREKILISTPVISDNLQCYHKIITFDKYLLLFLPFLLFISKDNLAKAQRKESFTVMIIIQRFPV